MRWYERNDKQTRDCLTTDTVMTIWTAYFYTHRYFELPITKEALMAAFIANIYFKYIRYSRITNTERSLYLMDRKKTFFVR